MNSVSNVLIKLDNAVQKIREFGDKLYMISTIEQELTMYPYDNVNLMQLSKEAFAIQDIIERGDYYKAIPRIRNYYPYFENDKFVKSLQHLNIDIDDELNALYTIVDILKEGEQFYLIENKIPNQLNDLTDEILLFFSEHPEYIYEITPNLFEKLTAIILKKLGMKVELTKQTRDGGYDILAIHDLKYTQHRYIIECKKYRKDRKVDIATVRSLYGIKNDLQASKIFLVTTSGYTSAALDFAKIHNWELELKDFNDLTYWLKMFWGKIKK